MAELTDDAFDKIMNANVKGTFWLCNMVIPQMAERGGGPVILLFGIAGLRGTTTIGCYGMSKAAEAALARNAALEWGLPTCAPTPSRRADRHRFRQGADRGAGTAGARRGPHAAAPHRPS
ncbi:hypothetical protein BG36_01315 [Aquamicrobium defluvii]|uniref:Short subunit dehydrogenase n=1 Tax=Aquamicrobium defluvii TaxID=69279 RepID=A0A011TG67_9HYPH|nr:hypothetical protein BG36_01315 [Aquamicrobium defluvii]EZQ17816.1 hypothetical protein CF98_32935 [Halopseudomonas bauzanensis]